MSLYGALFSGVSGLTAQSSAMGAISDNITNVSTIGYKNTSVSFQTLVTKQTSSTFYSAGGVQSRPLGSNDVQGLLQSSTSQTDISISGNGFFIVNESNTPGLNNQYLYTRAGSFTQDNQGYLKNTSGYYLQAWPTDAAGQVIPANDALSLSNQNIISTDYMETVNLNRVGGTAASTSTIAIGANLPANDVAGATHKTDVQFFDTLGNANTISVVYTQSAVPNQWHVTVDPAPGTSVMTIEDVDGEAYASSGLVQFKSRPTDASTMTIEGTTYEIDSDGAFTAGNIQVDTSTNTTLSQDVASLIAAVKANDTDFADYGSFTNDRIKVSPGSSTAIVFTEDGTRAIVVNPAAMVDSSGNPATTQDSQFTVVKQHTDYTNFSQFKFPGIPANGDTVTINGTTYTFDTTGAEGALDGDATIDASVSLAATLADLEEAIETLDASFSGTRVRVREDSDVGAVDTLVLESLDSGSFDITFSAGFTNLPTEPDGTVSYAAATAFAVDTNYAIEFDSSGLPAVINIAELELIDYANGAANMDDDPANTPQISLDFGDIGEANGMTQFGSEFTPTFITQNGSRFGTFAGVSINNSGLVTALFDNGEVRPIFQIPLATFVNANSLENRTGNVWNSTEASGDYTLRVADNGPSGQVVQSALEASTVDIGEEFTNMIVVQRAYSAAAKIISTADEMLEELMRTKR